eukprot:COSAG01_NODE_65814_length_272_cov_0.601156_1_plen_38_part_10
MDAPPPPIHCVHDSAAVLVGLACQHRRHEGVARKGTNM